MHSTYTLCVHSVDLFYVDRGIEYKNIKAKFRVLTQHIQINKIFRN